MIDSFYTSPLLADRLVAFSTQEKVSLVADFCVGDGELLRAAARRWPNAKFVATDMSKKALLSVKRNHPKWILGKCDFINDASRRQCMALAELAGKADLILMNPPFSCIGGTKHIVKMGGVHYSCSTAMKFLVTALQYISRTGQLYAILPHSVGYSERDGSLWKALVENHKLKILSKSGNKHFKGCSPYIILVSLNTSEHACIDSKDLGFRINASNVSICRGSIPMNEARKLNKGQYPLVHSTNLQNNTIESVEFMLDGNRSSFKGPAVLIPRVGTPLMRKVCLLPSGQRVILSDCVIALKTTSVAAAKALQQEILAKWEKFSLLYQGTGARYVALSSIKRAMGVD